VPEVQEESILAYTARRLALQSTARVYVSGKMQSEFLLPCESQLIVKVLFKLNETKISVRALVGTLNTNAHT